jgi:hypothetical protein
LLRLVQAVAPPNLVLICVGFFTALAGIVAFGCVDGHRRLLFERQCPAGIFCPKQELVIATGVFSLSG